MIGRRLPSGLVNIQRGRDGPATLARQTALAVTDV